MGDVTASAIGSVLLTHHIYVLNLLGVFCAVLAVAGTATLPQQLGRRVKGSVPETRFTSSELSDQIPEFGHGLFEEETDQVHRGQEIAHIFLTSWKRSLAALAKLHCVANPAFQITLMFFLHSFTHRVEVLSPQYFSLQLSWSLQSVNTLLAIKSFISGCVLVSLPTLRERCLEPYMSSRQCDVFIVQASIALNIIGMIGLGFRLPVPAFIVSMCIYTGGYGFLDSLTSFGLVNLSPEEEKKDFFLRTGLVQTIAGLIAAPAWTSFFSSCLKSAFLPIGTPFWSSACLFGGILVFALRLQRYIAYSAVSQEE